MTREGLKREVGVEWSLERGRKVGQCEEEKRQSGYRNNEWKLLPLA